MTEDARAQDLFDELSAMTIGFMGPGRGTWTVWQRPQSVEEQLKEEIRLMDEFNNRCFD